MKKIELFDKEYKYPGYFFNTGQLFITGGVLNEADISEYFDSTQNPMYKRIDLFPLVDQSLYNYLFVKYDLNKKLTLAKNSFMIWSESLESKRINIFNVINKQNNSGLMHYAGANRNPAFKNMSHKDILTYFQNYYYKKVKIAYLKLYFRSKFFEINKCFNRLISYSQRKLFSSFK
jgi:hypothetical protein